MTIEPLLESLEVLIGHAADTIGGERFDRAAELVRHDRRRVGFLGDALVVAFAGGTGSGKSSLLNAVAGKQVAEAGPIRPTTAEALAWTPVTAEPGVVRLLDDMGIEAVVEQDQYPHLTILDMPDTDSVEGSHRAIFERLLPRVDAVVWVVDPEKYNDRLLHDEYLQPLAEYADQFVFAFNQMDRLSDEERSSVVADLRDRLRIDGIVAPVIIETAADPAQGEPEGVDELLEVLAERLDAKQLVVEKVARDARRVAADVVEMGQLDGLPLGFDERWDTARDRAVSVLTDLVAGPEVREVAIRTGRAEGARKSTGPIGALAASMKDSAIGRLLGVQEPAVALEASTAQWDRRAGLEAVYSLLERFVGEIAADLGGQHSIRLRDQLHGSETPSRVRSIVERSLWERPFPDVRGAVPGWLRGFGIVKWLLAGVFVAGAIWFWAVPVQRGEWPWPIILMLGAIILGLATSRFAEGIGAKGGRILTQRFRTAIEDELALGLDREFGSVMRTHVRDKALLAAQARQVGELAEATLASMEGVEA